MICGEIIKSFNINVVFFIIFRKGRRYFFDIQLYSRYIFKTSKIKESKSNVWEIIK